ncbi:MAG: YbaN family protein, partial [Emcibacteraceae bacterium]|nr:YbaN family protein [Emcibacteraceae bacterium]
MEKKTKRFLYLSFGWAMFTLGFIGAFLPVLPTTPLMIVALWGFSNGSETLHDWLYNHPKFGSALQDWDKHRVIPFKAKLTAIVMMSISASYLLLFSEAPNMVIIISLGLMVYGALYILSKRSHKPV